MNILKYLFVCLKKSSETTLNTQRSAVKLKNKHALKRFSAIAIIVITSKFNYPYTWSKCHVLNTMMFLGAIGCHGCDLLIPMATVTWICCHGNRY